jgi:hypothetical protein
MVGLDVLEEGIGFMPVHTSKMDNPLSWEDSILCLL